MMVVEPTRRDRRRQETIDEILSIAEAIMDEEGVNGLSLSEVARRLGVKPPSIYKYFDSLAAIFDELFRRGQVAHLDALRHAMAGRHGLDAVGAALDASGRFGVARPALTQLLFFRPVPGFAPSEEAMAPSVEMVQLLRGAFLEAITSGEVGPKTDPDELVWLSSVIVSGVIGQTLANEPHLAWGVGRFSPQLAKLLDALPLLYPPTAKRR